MKEDCKNCTKNCPLAGKAGEELENEKKRLEGEPMLSKEDIEKSKAEFIENLKKCESFFLFCDNGKNSGSFYFTSHVTNNDVMGILELMFEKYPEVFRKFMSMKAIQEVTGILSNLSEKVKNGEVNPDSIQAKEINLNDLSQILSGRTQKKKLDS